MTPGRPWRVLYVTHTDRVSGGERSLLDLVTRLDRRRVHPVVVAGGAGNLAEAVSGAGIELVTLDLAREVAAASRRKAASLARLVLSPHLLWGAADRLARLVRELDADLIHTNSQKAHWIGLVAGWRTGTPVVWHFRDILGEGPLATLSRVGARIPARVIAISRAVAESLGVRPGRPDAKGRIRVIPNGVAQGRTPSGSGLPEGWRKGPIVGMVAQLARWKGPEVFLEAAARISRGRPEVRFVVVGGVLFPESEGPYDELLRRRAEELGLSGRLLFTGQVENARPWIAAMDVFVHPPIRPEPFGRVVLEAMHEARPIVATRGGGVDDLVLDGKSGVLVAPGDPEALTQAVLGLLADVDRARGLGREASRRALEGFPVESMVEGVMGVYEEVLGRA